MTNMFSRRFFMASLATALASAAHARAPSVSLRPVARPGTVAKKPIPGIQDIVAGSNLSGATGAAVVDLSTGRILEEHGGSQSLPPASVTKTVTALYALATLGAEYRFETRLLATGPISDGVLSGDLVLAGGGDPTLDTDGLADMARQLRQAGVTRVTGRLIVADGALPHLREIDGNQPDHVGYNPAISGLNLNFNRVHFEWRKSGSNYGVSMDARSANHRPDVRIARMSIAQRDLPVYTYKDAGDFDQWTVARAALGNGGSRWLPVRKPALYAGEVFTVFARAQGISVTGIKQAASVPSGSVLVRRQSTELRTILRDMLKYSNNMIAETVGMTVTKARRGSVSSLRASGTEMTNWARSSLGMQDSRFVDHSGLGDASRITARSMVQVLAAAGRHQVLRPILKPISIRDDNGKVVKDHPIQVHAKTGTLNFVSALAGYMTAPDGRQLAFAIFSADNSIRARIPKAERERPKGAKSWNGRAKRLQQALIKRWGAVYG